MCSSGNRNIMQTCNAHIALSVATQNRYKVAAVPTWADQEIGLGVGRPGDHRKTLYGIRVAQIACTKDKLHTATPECTMRYMHAVHLHVLCQGISNCIANKRNIRFMPINVHVCIRLLSEGLLP
jgi:hypothetical protein